MCPPLPGLNSSLKELYSFIYLLRGGGTCVCYRIEVRGPLAGIRSLFPSGGTQGVIIVDLVASPVPSEPRFQPEGASAV